MKKYIDNEKIDIERNDDVISATDTTGLIPSLPENDYEIASYEEINEFLEKPICRRQRYNNHQRDL